MEMNVFVLLGFAMCVGFTNDSTQQYTRRELYALGKKCKQDLLRPAADTVQEIGRQRIQRTRGRRGGKYRSQHRSSMRNFRKWNNLTCAQLRDVKLNSSKFALLNARSLKRNMQSIKHFLFLENVDIACISESWLHKDDIYPDR